MSCEPAIGAVEAARLLDVHPKTLLKRARAGEIPGFQIGRSWKFRASALDAYMRERLHCATPTMTAERRM
jgi:excisionase family DNA binding protein